MVNAVLTNGWPVVQVATTAIATCYIYNTSIIQDEVQSHRMGLISVRVDPRRFKYYRFRLSL
eukprot:m.432689 g.432689  ORF g.432689 m.432689 type:complete len:62 (-) comp21413_c0_seq5:419-604(-)